MWALRRASINLSNRCLSSGTTRIISLESEISTCNLENHNAEFSKSQVKTRFHSTSSFSKSFSVAQTFSSLSGAESSGNLLEDVVTQLETRHNTAEEAAAGDKMGDGSISGAECSENLLEDVLTQLETRRSTVEEAASEAEKGDGSIPESEFSVGESEADDIKNEPDMLDTESDACEKESSNTEAPSELIKAILSATLVPVSRILDGWEEVGNEVTQTEVSYILLFLYRRRMFDKALEVSEWLESRENLEFTESEYARRIDLIAKVQGIWHAEKYIQQIPESYRTEIVYCSLLKNYVAATNVNRAEMLFNTMKNSFPLTCISCNQLLFLYKRTNRKKIADVLSLMEKENIKWSNITYQILIDVKGQSKDISGMEQILETMKSQGVEPSLRNQASVAHYYAARGRAAEAEAVLKDMEGGDLVKNRYACRFLLPVYAKLGREDEVGRIWKECESNPHQAECIAAIRAWGALKRIEEAEAAFDQLAEILKNPVSKHHVVLLDVYADHKMVTKGEELFNRMTEGGATARVPAWEALAKLYAGAGKLEEADAILEKLIQQRKVRPRATSFLNVLDEYARRGDVRNAEKIFQKMRNSGYGVEPRPYHSLLYAYINAKAPTDGFKERLRRDNVVPDRKLASLLARAAALGKSVVV